MDLVRKVAAALRTESTGATFDSGVLEGVSSLPQRPFGAISVSALNLPRPSGSAEFPRLALFFPLTAELALRNRARDVVRYPPAYSTYLYEGRQEICNRLRFRSGVRRASTGTRLTREHGSFN